MADDESILRLQRLERVTAGSLDGYWERNLRTNVSWYSPSFWAMFGFRDNAMPSDRNVVNARMHPEDRPTFEAAYRRAIDELGRFTYEMRYLDASDQWRWIRGRGQVWPDAQGRAEFITGAVSDIHAEKMARQSLAAVSRRFEQAIEASDEGLFERIVGEPELYMSDRYLELIGFRRDEIAPLRESLLARVHPDDLARVHAVVDGAVNALQRWEVPFRLRHAGGEYRWYRQRGVAERLPDGRIRVTGMLADIHEQTTQREELERTRAQLETLVAERTARLEAALALARERQLDAERANAAKSRFLAHMSHEIRTPLNGVLGLVELARRGATTPELQRYLDTAGHAGQTLLKVINMVLDFSRIEAGRLELRPHPFDLAEAVVQTIRNVMPLVRERGLLMLFDWEDGPHWVDGDEAAIRQIVSNLVGNAAKFTERGEIRVIGRAEALADGHLQVQIVVQDTGPGIAPEQIDRVFQAFEQGDFTLARRHGGTGLGLAIARSLAEAMGGGIAVSCPAEGGSRFEVTLRLGAAAAPAELLPAPGGEVWLVHATPAGGAWIGRRLARMGWHMRRLDNVEEMLAQMRRADTTPPQLVLLSESALADGLDLAAVRAALPRALLRLLVRPDWHLAPLEAEAAALGITCVMTPISPTELVRLTLAAAPPAQAPQRPHGEAGGLRWQAGTRVLLVEDNPVNQLIGQEFLRALGFEVRTAGDGRQALTECIEFAPALVLMDLQMPGMDGLEATRHLRQLQAEGRWGGAPILALTAHAGPTDHAACLDAGMDGVLTKPLSLESLGRQLAPFLQPAPSVSG